MSYLTDMTKKTLKTDYIVQIGTRLVDEIYGLDETTQISALTGKHSMFIENHYYFNNHTRCDDYNRTHVRLTMESREDFQVLESIFRSAGLKCFMEETGYVYELVHGHGRIPDRLYRDVPTALAKTLFQRSGNPQFNVSVKRVEK